MRYRVRAIRVETAEKVVSATDEDDAIRKVQEELAKPYSFFGRWETKALDLQVVSAETRVGEAHSSVPTEGPLLLSVNEAAKLLGFSRTSLDNIVRAGEIEHVRVGRRVLLARSALTKFIEVNSRSGYYS
jgi:excisionase family DNA binding protein